MAEDANANIRIDIDTTAATAALKALQGQIARFHTEMARGGAVAGQNAAKLQQDLINSINAGGQFQAGMTKVQSTTEAFTTALEKNKLSMGQYFRYAGASTKTFGRFFRGEFETITKVATERVKDLQTQYISMGRDANGALKSIKVRPLTLDMNDLATKTMIAAQKQQLYNQLLKQGSTNLLNFGKNTQWAGRQLMVGFTLPLTLFASTAAKSFMEIEKQVIRIRRVYGDFSTTVAETDQMIDSIKTLAGEYTKYGVAVSDTLGLAAEAAAAGKSGQELLAQISEATRLAVLGNVEQTQALETTMSVTNAFGTATEDLAKKIDFLNAVENQSVTSIEDLTIAIPKAGPVVQQLGGDVEDLAFFLTAMKEGGINASEGANALKSGLAALINPTGKAKEMLQGFGINIDKIVNSNKGDIQGLVIDFASALDTLDPLSRARAIEQLFGKFQFSRLSTLFQNVIGEGTQASRVLELTKATTQELAILSQRELKKVEDTTTYKFEKAFADFQAALAPVGEQFLKAITPVIEFGTKLLNQFNNMSDGAKSFAVILTTVVAGIGPVLLMTVGLVANGVANLIKMFQLLGNIFNKSGADTTTLGLQTEYMTQQQLEAAAVAASLGQSHSRLAQVFSVEAAALNNLTLAYQKAVTAQRGFAMPGGRVAGSAAKPKTYASGVVSVPGPKGKGDVVPAMLSPGEAVIPAKMAKKYGSLINGMISNNIPGYETGLPAPTFATQAAGFSINKILEGITSGAIKIEKAEEIVAKTLIDISNQTKTSMNSFVQRLGANAEKISGQSIANQINKFYQNEIGGQGKLFRYSASGVGTIEQQMGNAGRLDELERAKKRLEAEAALGLPGQLQIDRAHRVETGVSGKLFPKQAFTAEAFNPQTHSENAISNALSGSNRVSGFMESYSKNLKIALDKGEINQKEYNSILEKAKNNLALSEKELATQAKVLQQVVATEKQMLVKNQALSNDIQRTIAGANVPGGLAVNTDAGQITAEAKKIVLEDLEAAKAGVIQGVRESTKQASPSKAAYDSGSNIGQGAINGLNSKVDDAKIAGENIGQATVNGTQSGARRGGTGTRSTRQQGPTGSVAPIFMSQRERDERKEMIRQRAKNAFGVGGKVRKVGGKIAAGVKNMGGMGAGMGIAMAGSMVGSMVPGLEGLGMAAGLAGSALMMFPGPVGIVVAALTGLVGVAMSLNAAQEEQRKKAIALGDATVMSTASLKQMSEDLGTVSISETVQQAQASALTQTSAESLSAGQQYFRETESGQSILTDAKAATKEMSDPDFIERIANNFAYAVAQGTMPADQAKDYVAALAVELGRGDLAVNLKAQITQTIGQDGKNLFADPGKTTDSIIRSSLDQTMSTLAEAEAAMPSSTSTTTISGGTAVSYDNAYDAGAGTQTAINAARQQGISELLNTYSQATGSGDIIGNEYGQQIQALMDKQKGLNLGSQEYLKTEQEILTLQANRATALQENRDIQSEIYTKIEEQRQLLGADEFNKIIEVKIKETYGEGGTSFLEELKAYDGSEDFKIGITAALSSGGMNLATAQGLLDTAIKNKSLETMYTVTLKENGLQAAINKTNALRKIIADTQRGFTITADNAERILKNAGNIQPYVPASILDGGSVGDTGDTVSGGGGGGGSSATTEDPIMARLQKRLAKQNALLNLISLKEAKINKRFDERKKVLEEISKLNGKIAEQQRGQLDVADALTRGDIASAARAVQAERVRAAALAHEQQMLSLERQRQAELANVTVRGKTRREVESKIDRLNMKIARREYRTAASGGMMRGYSGGGMMKGYSVGGKVMSYFADGGSPLGSDTIPAMLTPGEFVIKRPAVQNFGVKNLQAINSGSNPSSGVYNYSISVNVSTEANPDQIARAVAQNVRRTESYRIRGNKL